MTNKLFYGDNLDVLRQHVADASVDLVYLNPPFQSGRDYSVIFESRRGERGDGRAKARAFTDTWTWGDEAEAAFAEAERAGGVLPRTLRALASILGESDLMAYLAMMAPRLVELRRVLKPTGSLYLHCDPTASHYLKLLLDGVFGPACFRNEIIWRYRRWPTVARRYQRMHDVLLFYTARPGNQHHFAALRGYERLAASTLKTFGKKKQRADFSSGHRKPGVTEEETEGPPLSDTWEVGVIAPIGKERTGYPTQKPEALLERVIRSSSREGDVVLDPFCGSGTTLAVAERLGRLWLGIDLTHLAVDVARARLKDADVEVVGEPVDLSSARRLAAADPAQFRLWLLGRAGARPMSSRREHAGIDGELFFCDGPRGTRAGRLVLSIKTGEVAPADTRDLGAALARENAEMGALLTLAEPAEPVRAEAARAGFYDSSVGRYPRVQVLSASQLLAGEGLVRPGAAVATGPALVRTGNSRIVRLPPRDEGKYRKSPWYRRA